MQPAPERRPRRLSPFCGGHRKHAVQNALHRERKLIERTRERRDYSIQSGVKENNRHHYQEREPPIGSATRCLDVLKHFRCCTLFQQWMPLDPAVRQCDIRARRSRVARELGSPVWSQLPSDSPLTQHTSCTSRKTREMINAALESVSAMLTIVVPYPGLKKRVRRCKGSATDAVGSVQSAISSQKRP